MTNPRIPRPEPGGPRPRTTDELLRLEGAGRISRRLAVAAIAVSVLGLGLAAWGALTPAGSGCQAAAWSATPAKSDLPAGWSVAASQYDVDRKSMSLLGPLPADETVNRPVVVATITCFADGAADAVARSADAATAAGLAVVSRNDLGDQGYSASDDAGGTFVHFRHDRLVGYLAEADGDTSDADMDRLASAFDKALGGDGGAVVIGTPGAATPAPSDDTGTPDPTDEASPSQAAVPELEAALPAKVGDLAMVVTSWVGSAAVGEDQAGRAIAAALRDDGRVLDDLGLAQAYDETLTTDLSLWAFRVKDMTVDKVKVIVTDLWLTASGPGITRDTVTLAGTKFTRIDYGDKGLVDYVTTKDAIVIVITTSDPTLAAQAAAALP